MRFDSGRPAGIHEDTAALCNHAEATGYDGVWLADHLPDEDERFGS